MQAGADAIEDPVNANVEQGNAATLHSHGAGSSGSARTADQEKALAAAGLEDDGLDAETRRTQQREQLLASLNARTVPAAGKAQKPTDRKRTRQAGRLAAEDDQGAGTSSAPDTGAGKKQKTSENAAQDEAGACFLLKDVQQLSKTMPEFLNNPDIVPLWKKAGVTSITMSRLGMLQDVCALIA